MPLNSGNRQLVARLEDQKVSGVAGGTFTAGAWQVRELNTEVFDDGGVVTLSGNQFTLKPGRYLVEFGAPAFRVGRHKARLYNVTEARDDVGRSAYADASYYGDNESHGVARLSISEEKTFRIEHQCQSTFAAQGLGVAGGAHFSVANESYTFVNIYRVG